MAGPQGPLAMIWMEAPPEERPPSSTQCRRPSHHFREMGLGTVDPFPRTGASMSLGRKPRVSSTLLFCRLFLLLGIFSVFLVFFGDVSVWFGVGA